MAVAEKNITIEPDDLQKTLSFRKNTTGVDNTVITSPRGNARHGPTRIMRSLTMLFRAAAVTLALATPVKAEEPVQTCTGRVTAVVDNGEYFGKPVRLLGVKSRKDCSFFYTERFSTDARRILQTCPIGSRCRVKARLSGGDGGIATIISVTRIK
jgi:hypothetical protein